MRTDEAQIAASDPRASAFVAANAGAGKTATLVRRVARVLLGGARPEAILCVTYTKAAAAEMQRRLFKDLGAWAVMDDAALAARLAEIGEGLRGGDSLARARRLFARALDTPGGLKIQTLHAFCEQLLRRFPLEAGVHPGFQVLDERQAAHAAQAARAAVARTAADAPAGVAARAYAHFAIQLRGEAFDKLFTGFGQRRAALAAYFANHRQAGFPNEVWRRCGFDAPTSRAAIHAECLGRIRWRQWRRAAERLGTSAMVTDQKLAAAMAALGEDADVEQVWPLFLTKNNTERARFFTKSVDADVRDWLESERDRHAEACRRASAAGLAEETCHALVLAQLYLAAYEDAKAARGALDFADLIARSVELISVRADAAWVLYKLDGGVDHVLLDEGQDTAPEQWDLLAALTGEFFTGLGSRGGFRTIFAVADEKQSIFSFQGAAPERFAAQRQDFQRLIEAAGGRFASPTLRESWRSTPEILAFVDKVFADPDARAGLLAGSDSLPPRHLASRPPGGGVDLWPLEPRGEAPEPAPLAPVDAAPENDANRRLADRIAADILRRVLGREAVIDRVSRAPRPCRFGDMLILVRRRNALFHEIIRALKRAGVAVGGADRLALSEHGAFQDLLALGRFVRFPDDELTLACLLRGPFCDVSEDDLYDLAHPREAGLWDELRGRAGERPAWADALAVLDHAIAEAAARSPFDFYERMLNRLDDAGRSLRQRLLTRLGGEAEQAVAAFLAEVLAAEQRGARDLEQVIADLADSVTEVTREADEREDGEGETRVMTVHGAKGLEAPIVYLPDTTARATPQDGALLQTADGGFLYAPRKGDDCEASAAAREAREAAGDRESTRLLYVALTRARDRLIIAGVESQAYRFQRSWRDFVERAFGELANRPFLLDSESEGRRFGCDPLVAEASATPETVATPPPAWIGRPAPREGSAARAPRPSGDVGAALSPLAEIGGLDRWRRGALIHALLQQLPEAPPESRSAFADRRLAREAGLTPAQRAEIAAAALRVLGDRRFAAVFGPGSRAEVSLVGAVRGQPVAARVDRLVVTPEKVLVIDFKTNRVAPDDAAAASPAYIRQLALYVALLRQIYPGREIEAALLWTDGPTLMPVPTAILDKALSALQA